MTYRVFFNVLLLMFLYFIAVVFYTGVDYSSLVDPAYYINATEKSITLSDSTYYGERWHSDLGFIFFSFLINKLDSSYQDIGVIYSSLITLLFFSTLIKYKEAPTYIFILLGTLLLFNFTMMGLVFNVWRQGFSCSIILLSILFHRRRALLTIVALGFHINSAIFYCGLFLYEKVKEENKLISFFILLISIFLAAYYFKVNYDLYKDSLEVYSDSASNAPYARYLLAFSYFAAVTIVNYVSGANYCTLKAMDSFSYISFTLLVGLIFLIVVPSASERFMHYFFIIFPFYLMDSYLMIGKKFKVWILIISFLAISVNYFLVFKTSIYSLMIYDSLI